MPDVVNSFTSLIDGSDFLYADVGTNEACTLGTNTKVGI